MLRDLSDAEARAALPLKWGVPEDTIPAWVAEMDFALAPAVREAAEAAVARGVTGYPPFGDGGVGEAFSGFAARHWGWGVPADASVVAPGVVPGLRLALDVLVPPGPVVVPLPCYPPFRDVVALAGREASTSRPTPTRRGRRSRPRAGRARLRRRRPRAGALPPPQPAWPRRAARGARGPARPGRAVRRPGPADPTRSSRSGPISTSTPPASS